jgi:hypothetical protein
MDGEDLAGRRAKAIRLNECITEAEVVEPMKSMKSRKAADELGFRAELLQAGVEELASTLTVMFNKIWKSGEIPKEWNEGVLVPIHKKGDMGECSNYWTITIGPALRKLYAIMVERRLTPWAEEQGSRARGQAGFRHDHRVLDHLFTLQAPLRWRPFLSA